MSRPGRIALRISAITGALFAVIVPSGFSAQEQPQPVTALSGETFETVPALGQQTTFGAYTCDKNGNTTVPFQSQGVAQGPYVGTFTETGTVTIGPQTNTTLDSRGVGPILAFQASFSIASQFPPATITGTKQLGPGAPVLADLSSLGRCNPDGSSPPTTDMFALVANPFLTYSAQITTAAGSRTDNGTSGVLVQSVSSVTSPTTFQEAFTSTDPVPPACEDGNNGNGVGQGHPKKNNDNDDNEFCR
jgi:hypothetical protein